MFTREFLKDALERALGSAAAAVGSVVTVDQLVNVAAFDWTAVGWVALAAAGLSLLKSIAARNVGSPESGSLRK